uniref:Uncharacterized protein n=1 Tax=Anguilla anguilla TaxID=7936 RepID=A0A0E9RZX3_ANGAN
MSNFLVKKIVKVNVKVIDLILKGDASPGVVAGVAGRERQCS